MVGLVPGVVFFLLVLIGSVVTRRREKKEWNNGICAESGRPWVNRDVDLQGGRLYSDMAGNDTWVSYGVDKIRITPAPRGCLFVSGKERGER